MLFEALAVFAAASSAVGPKSLHTNGPVELAPK
jgi:hypothetical protein